MIFSSCSSAFFVFCSEYRPSVKQQFPGVSIGECAKKLGEMWSKLSQSEKQPYEEKAQKLREKYDRVSANNTTEFFFFFISGTTGNLYIYRNMFYSHFFKTWHG